jgi:hypothetical protein
MPPNDETEKDESTGISWESVYTIPRNWVDVLICYVLLLESCIWTVGTDAISRCIKFCTDLGESTTETTSVKGRKHEPYTGI